MEGPPPSFWGQIIPPGQTAFLDHRDDCLVYVTNAVLGSIPESAPLDPIRVIARVRSALPSGADETPDGVAFPVAEATVALCVLRPLTAEQQEISLTVSALDLVEVTNPGAVDVHLSGVQEALEDLGGEEEDRAEVAALTADEIQGRFRAMAAQQGPRPPPKAKKGKKGKGREEMDGAP
jgi:hypothetical protein